MKSLTNNTLAMAVAMTLWATAAMAGEMSNLPVNLSEKNTTSATAANSPVLLHALSRLDAKSLAAQAMTDQELKVVEGGWSVSDLPRTKMGWDIPMNVKR